MILDVPSTGRAPRILGWKSCRIHQFMSDNERDYFYLLEWSDLVKDIREQFPLLPLEETLTIAEEIGVKHPIDPKTKEPIVMTTDFVITTGEGEISRTIKPSLELEKRTDD